MGIADLDADEQLALGGLLRMMIRRDGEFSEAEEAQVDAIGQEHGGREVLWRMISRSAQDLRDDAAIRVAAGHVKRAEAQQVIYDVLDRVACADGKSAAEDAMLAWIKSIW